ncbi:MAG: HAD family hydrolase [Oscillospiraceae bacterium]|nr:HAD family hydrolase [Oscillospiraceae bacterium]
MTKLILWDWNGTLLNDVSASLAAVNDMMERRGRRDITLGEYRRAIGVPIRKFYEYHFDLEREDYPQILTEYARGYEKYLPECALAKGARELLARLQKDGVKQVVLSSGEQKRVENALRVYGVAEYFDTVLGASDFFAGSKLERARDFLNAQKISPCEILMTGDLVHDWETARELGTRCVLVNWGHQGSEQFAGLNAAVISALVELEI